MTKKAENDFEDITDAGLILKTFKKDSELRDEFEKLIWKTIIRRSWVAILALIGAVIIIPIFSWIFKLAMIKLFGWNLS